MIEEEAEPEPRENAKIIGITGGIGSGKSTVSKLIEDAGYPVYYSDIRAKTIVNDHAQLQQQIKQLLGEKSYDENGLYDRKFVADIVFENEEILLKLNSMIHPAVKIDFENWVDQQISPFVFKETALLFELKLHESCYKSLLVTADDNCRLKRVMDRDNKTYREVETIMLRQMPEKDKVKLADFVIFNNDGLEELEKETKKILAAIVSS